MPTRPITKTRTAPSNNQKTNDTTTNKETIVDQHVISDKNDCSHISVPVANSDIKKSTDVHLLKSTTNSEKSELIEKFSDALAITLRKINSTLQVLPKSALTSARTQTDLNNDLFPTIEKLKHYSIPEQKEITLSAQKQATPVLLHIDNDKIKVAITFIIQNIDSNVAKNIGNELLEMIEEHKRNTDKTIVDQHVISDKETLTTDI